MHTPVAAASGSDLAPVAAADHTPAAAASGSGEAVTIDEAGTANTNVESGSGTPGHNIDDDRPKCLCCLEALPTTEMLASAPHDLITLKCMHTFHAECIGRWAASRGRAVEDVPCPGRCEVDRRAEAAIDFSGVDAD